MGATPTRVLTGLALLTLTTLTACTGTADPTPPPTQTATRAPTTAPNPTPTRPVAPVMPHTAKAHTKAGAKAFVRYFWTVVNYAEITGDVSALTPTFMKGCTACEGGAAGIRDIYRKGGDIVGGDATVVTGPVLLSYAGPFILADLEVTLKTRPQREDFPGDTQDRVRPAAVVHDMFHLSATEGGAWRVAQFEVSR